jgi:hypothetical protein
MESASHWAWVRAVLRAGAARVGAATQTESRVVTEIIRRRMISLQWVDLGFIFGLEILLLIWVNKNRR